MNMSHDLCKFKGRSRCGRPWFVSRSWPENTPASWKATMRTLSSAACSSAAPFQARLSVRSHNPQPHNRFSSIPPFCPPPPSVPKPASPPSSSMPFQARLSVRSRLFSFRQSHRTCKSALQEAIHGE